MASQAGKMKPHPGPVGVGVFQFGDLPLELQVKVMLEMNLTTCRHFLSASRHATLIFYRNYQAFLNHAATKVNPTFVITPDLLQIIYRILQLQSERAIRPFHRSPAHWISWMTSWRSRHVARTPPPFPKTLSNLKAFCDLIDVVSWWSQELCRDLEMLPHLYTFVGNTAINTTLIPRNIEAGQATMPFSRIPLSRTERYRLNRALLVWNLYCLLFHQPANSRDHLKNGRVSEQMMFLSSLSTPLLCELDAVYDLMEDTLTVKFCMCCRRRNTSVLPARLAQMRASSHQPAQLLQNKDIPTSSAAMEYAISFGFAELLGRIILPGRRQVVYPVDFPIRDGTSTLWWTQNRFYSLPLGRVLHQRSRSALDHSNGAAATGCVIPSHLVSVCLYGLTQYGATGGTARQFTPIEDAKLLEDHQYYRTKGLCLWDEARIQKAADNVRELNWRSTSSPPRVFRRPCWCRERIENDGEILQWRSVAGASAMENYTDGGPVLDPLIREPYSIQLILEAILPVLPAAPPTEYTGAAQYMINSIPGSPRDEAMVQVGGRARIVLPPHPFIPRMKNFDPPIPYDPKPRQEVGGAAGSGSQSHQPPVNSEDGMEFDKWAEWSDGLACEIIGGRVLWMETPN